MALPSTACAAQSPRDGRAPRILLQPGTRPHRHASGTRDDAPWTPSVLAPRLIATLATGRYDALAGLYLHADPSRQTPLAVDLGFPINKDPQDDTQLISFSFGFIQ